VKEHLTNLDDSSGNPQSRQRGICDLTLSWVLWEGFILAAVSSSVILLEA